MHNGCRSTNKLKPDSNSQNPHSTFKRGPNGNIEHYATYKPNPKNPTGFDEVLRYDGVGKAHRGIPTPHIHERNLIRPANPWEIPKMGG